MKPSLEPALQEKPSTTTERGRARAQAILQAAYALFVAQGYAGFSMRSVAARVGISLSNLQHYYPSKDSLIEEMLLSAYGDYQHRIDQLFEAMPQATPLQRFEAAMDLFLAALKNPQAAGSITQTWVMALQHPAAVKTVAKLQARERKTIFKLIRGLSPQISDDEYQVRAALIVAQIEGLALQFAGRDRRPFTSAQLDAAARASFLRLATQP
ncbi:TetR/AcrR family transcriptional regulator [Eleftheria terrae]|uniref:TetR/AcrR family transcriptional regulator n=1 Tax=Eleftheria terrae TaxID=1597781 RepID=UPI00263AD804|nr:TetR/AcrR family transcriptional regulator [Eleftheria terrae]WKB55293.1 TetR/AcrR family transcriptional regulator [Eleftheria terrae]